MRERESEKERKREKREKRGRVSNIIIVSKNSNEFIFLCNHHMKF